MTTRLLFAGMAFGLTIALPVYANQNLAQASASATQGGDSSLPGQKVARSYVGGSAGFSDYTLSCSGGLQCADRDVGLKIYAGSRINNILGFELGYLDLGKVEFAGGDATARGVNASLLFNAAIGAASGVHAKVGTTYGRTDVSSLEPGAPTGGETDFGLSYGLGVTAGLSRNWQLRADWDRYKFEFASGDREIDLYSVGLQYRF